MVKVASAVHSEVVGVVADGKMGTWQKFDLATEKDAFLRECELLEHRDGIDFAGIFSFPDMPFSDLQFMALSKAGIGPFDRVREVLTGERGAVLMRATRTVAIRNGNTGLIVDGRTGECIYHDIDEAGEDLYYAVLTELGERDGIEPVAWETNAEDGDLIEALVLQCIYAGICIHPVAEVEDDDAGERTETLPF